jgi:hypothetical protein
MRKMSRIRIALILAIGALVLSESAATYINEGNDSVKFTGGLGELFGVSNESLTGKAFALHSKAKKSPRGL